MLIGSQVTASALLLVCAAVFLRSTYTAATAESGVRTDDTVVVRGITESARPGAAARRHATCFGCIRGRLVAGADGQRRVR